MNTDNSPPYADCLQQICNAVVTQQAPVAVYANNYHNAHIRALENTYPATCETLGHAVFAPLAWVYTLHHYPSEWDINLYGDTFPSFLLAQTQGVRAHEFNWRQAARIAAIEYLISELYYAEDPCFSRNRPCILPAKAIEPLQTIAHSLQKHHPYAHVAKNLALNAAVTMWREGLQIHLANTGTKTV